VVRGRGSPTCRKTYCTYPEQSKPARVVPASAASGGAMVLWADPARASSQGDAVVAVASHYADDPYLYGTSGGRDGEPADGAVGSGVPGAGRSGQGRSGQGRSPLHAYEVSCRVRAKSCPVGRRDDRLQPRSPGARPDLHKRWFPRSCPWC